MTVADQIRELARRDVELAAHFGATKLGSVPVTVELYLPHDAEQTETISVSVAQLFELHADRLRAIAADLEAGA